MSLIRYVLVAFPLLAAVYGLATAQSPVRAIDSLRVRTDDPRDNSVPQLRFGFGADYTDGPDTADGKGEFPFPFIGGPGGFAAALYVRDFLGDPGYDYRDIRGLPDSVTSLGLGHFVLVYTIRFQAGIGRPILQTYGRLNRGIDSIVLNSTQPGANYRHVFLPEGGVDTVSRREITELQMHVYFNYTRAASTPPTSRPTLVVLTPNPISSGGRVRAGSDPLREEGAFVLNDVMGRSMQQVAVAPGQQLTLDTPADLPPGTYFLRLEEEGRVVGVSRLVVVR